MSGSKLYLSSSLNQFMNLANIDLKNSRIIGIFALIVILDQIMIKN